MDGANFKPKCLATTIGSMPHTDPQRAVEITFAHTPDIPAWPELSHLSFKESMAIQVSENMPAARIDEAKGSLYLESGAGLVEEMTAFYEHFLAQDLEYFAISDEFAQGFKPFLGRLRGAGRLDAKMVKGQVIGPISFGLTITDQTKAAVLYDDTLRDGVIKTLGMKARWQRSKLKEAAADLPNLIFFDEPYLQSYGSAYVKLNEDEVIAYLNECFELSGGMVGLHCCGKTDWGLILKTNLDVLSFDAFDHIESLSLYPDALSSFLERGGIIAFGIIPSDDKITGLNPDFFIRRFEEAVDLLAAKGLDKETILASSLITPNCGTGSMSVAAAEWCYELCGLVSKVLRDIYFKGED